MITELPEGYVTMSETFDSVIGTGLYGNDSSIMILSYESISEQGNEFNATNKKGISKVL